MVANRGNFTNHKMTVCKTSMIKTKTGQGSFQVATILRTGRLLAIIWDVFWRNLVQMRKSRRKVVNERRVAGTETMIWKEKERSRIRGTQMDNFRDLMDIRMDKFPKDGMTNGLMKVFSDGSGM